LETAEADEVDIDDRENLPKKCGGWAGLECPQGFICDHASHAADAFGSCVLPILAPHRGRALIANPAAGFPKQCGGFAGIQCPRGFLCSVTSEIADDFGTCVLGIRGARGRAVRKSSAVQQAKCGGIAGLPCPTGFVCQTPPGTFDAFGTCVAASASSLRINEAEYSDIAQIDMPCQPDFTPLECAAFKVSKSLIEFIAWLDRARKGQ